MDGQAALEALKRANFASTAKLDSIWSDDRECHVPGIHDEVIDAVERSFRQLQHHSETLGEVVRGSAGTGKTHLLGELRRRLGDEAYFVAFNLADLNDFWEMAAIGFLDSLERPDTTGKRQLASVLEGYLEALGVPEARRTFIETQKTPSSVVIDNYLAEGRRKLGRRVREHRDTIRALFLLNASEPEVSDVGYSILQSFEVENADEYGFARAQLSPYTVVRGISWIASLSRPTVLVVDQLDPVVAWAHAATTSEESPETSASSRRAAAIIEGLTGGIMELFDATQRTLTVLACLNQTWNVLLSRGLSPAIQRFKEPRLISSVREPNHIESMVAQRLTQAFASADIEPPYTTWPFTRDAISSAQGLSPREILRHCERRIDAFLNAGKIYEVTSLSDDSLETAGVDDDIGARFESLLKTSSLDGLFDSRNEDREFKELLVDCLECYVLEGQLPTHRTLAIESDFEGRRPPLHARARYILHDADDREIHECFRSISHSHPRAVTARLKAAITSSGVDPALNLVRSLTIIRNVELSRGTVTQQLIRTIEDGGGRVISVPQQELAVMVAIRRLYHERSPGFEQWLSREQPLSKLSLFAGLQQRLSMSAASDGATVDSGADAQPAASAAPSPASLENGPPHSTPASSTPAGARATDAQTAQIFVGISEDAETPVGIPIEALPRHTVILAGSGSGKTVFIRRMIEEAARTGVPAIVLDPNNDLARLGDRWPEPPDGWWEGDEARAADYFSKAEVKVWTPRLSAGRPLALSPIPDFSALENDPDSITRAIDMAAATLGPLIGASGAKGHLKQGLLVECLRSFAHANGRDLTGFVSLLSNLPSGVSEIQGAEKMASEMADHLRAAIAKNPLLGSDATPLDPGTLLSANESGRTAVSVINFSGLHNDDDRQAFVNQLNMALFSWLKHHPAAEDRPINGLLVIDEAQNFVPSQRTTPSSESTISLISQARKYGLGLVLATQQPKGLHNAVISNCTTHAYGKMNSPAAISAIKELGNAKGAALADIAALQRGQFYFSTEGHPVPIRIRTPLCLSHHPSNPLSEDEVVVRAAGRASANRPL